MANRSVSIDALADEIRRLNGKKKMGAGALAEELTSFIEARTDGRTVDVDELAQEIRRTDGNNSLSPDELAEALTPFLDASLA